MTALYNEIDPFAADWLENLILVGAIAPGIVDRRSVVDLTPEYLSGFTQVHLFAGIGVWSYALRRAGWSDDRPCWTASFPCQPFSAAGQGVGFDDERHLWPAGHHLITICRPSVLFGEQVSSKDGLAWLDLVHSDMEATGYAFGALDLCSAGVGAPHIRQRTHWMAYAQGGRGREQFGEIPGTASANKRALARQGNGDAAWPLRTTVRLGNNNNTRLERLAGHGDDRNQSRRDDAQSAGPGRAAGGAGRLGDADSKPGERRAGGVGRTEAPIDGAGLGEHGPIGDRRSDASQAGGLVNPHGRDACAERQQRGGEQRFVTSAVVARDEHRGPGPTNGQWGLADWLFCRDGKWRPVEPGTFPLVNGASNRVGSLRGYGNAINAALAQEFIEVGMEYLSCI